ncbi:MAG: hypothetical protein HY922_04510 [Elusimicrobia bacterium]|nr:hypothetical protein [Elusimicrobiota bacterium]
MHQPVFLERHLKGRLAQLLGQAGLPWRFADRAVGADFRLRIGESVLLGEALLSRSGVHFNEKVRQLKALAEGKRAIPLLAAPSLSPRRQEILRSQGICFVDLVGNAWIKAPGVLIDQRSRERKALGFREVNAPFSDKSSLVLRVMMDAPDRYWGNNEIADKASVSPGWVSQICRRLEELRYAVRAESRKLKLFRPQDVLEDWVEFYRLRKQEQHRFRCPGDSIEAVMNALKNSKAFQEHKGLLSFQAGASLVAPHAGFQEAHVYSEGLPASIDGWKRELRLEEAAPGESNLVLVSPYYSVSGRYGSIVVGGFPVVSDVQLYLDLRMYPLRGEEQARHLFEKRLAPKWHLEATGG